MLLTWAPRWTGNPPWIILVWSAIAAWETQPFWIEKVTKKWLQAWLLSEIFENFWQSFQISLCAYIYIYIRFNLSIIYTCYNATYDSHFMILYYQLYNIHQQPPPWFSSTRRSGSDTDSTTATVGSSSSAISSSLETSVIRSLKAEGPKYSCVNCSA